MISIQIDARRTPPVLPVHRETKPDEQFPNSTELGNCLTYLEFEQREIDHREKERLDRLFAVQGRD